MDIRSGTRPSTSSIFLAPLALRSSRSSFWCRHWFADEHVHATSAGQKEISTLSKAEVLSCWTENEFCMPPIRALPPDTEYKTKHKGTMKAWWSSSGHIVVKPVLNGTEGVYMILDTGMGSSNLLVTPSTVLHHCCIKYLHLHGAFPTGIWNAQATKTHNRMDSDP